MISTISFQLVTTILADVNNSLTELGKLSVNDLKKRYKGIGQAKAISIAACIELGKRRAVSDGVKLPKICASMDVFHLMKGILSDLKHEEFWALYLDRSNQVMSKTNISKGGISSTIFDVRIILKTAIDHLASGIIICHNHPSGNDQPSASDKQITIKMQDAGKLLDIQLLDHIIVCGQKYYSFADEGLL